MTDRKPKRPRDTNQLAKQIVDIATGETEDDQQDTAPLAAERGRAGGLKGGKARAASLSPHRRAEIAKKAAGARWSARNDDE